MRLVVAGAALVIAASITGCAHPEIVGYDAGWKPQTIIAPGDATVIDYAFAYVAADGSLMLDGPPMEGSTPARLRALKDRDPGLRLMISVGGWTRSDRFS